MIRTQTRVRVAVRVIYLNQTDIRHQILGGVDKVKRLEWCTPDRMLRVRIPLNLSWIVFFLKNCRHFDFYEHFIRKFHIRKVKCLVRGGCQFGGETTARRVGLPPPSWKFTKYPVLHFNKTSPSPSLGLHPLKKEPEDSGFWIWNWEWSFRTGSGVWELGVKFSNL